MSQDIVADALNQIMNAKKAGKDSVKLKRHSKFLLSLLALGKLKGYISDYSLKDGNLKIKFSNLNFCKAVKPRYVVKILNMNKYVKRYLPARDIGALIITTNQGLMTHQTALDKNLGGSLIAYFY
jgi:small subunit ribosomal protein S8